MTTPRKKTAKRALADNLDAPDLYLNRELGWLAFNQRVVSMAADATVPLLERVKFLAIAASSLDEFFMKRIGGLKQQLAAGVQETTVDGRTPSRQLAECSALIRRQQGEREELAKGLWRELTAAGVEICGWSLLSASERKAAREEYYRNIFPLVTPQSMDPAHPFPFISNLSLNLLVTLRYPHDGELSYARVKVPVSAGAPRFVKVGKKERYVLLEELMAQNLDLLFPQMEVVACDLFRVTRNANTSAREEHAEDLLALIESTLRERKFAPIVRLQVRPGLDPLLRGRLAAELGLDEEADVFECSGLMGVRDLMEVAQLPRPELKYPPHHPSEHPALVSQRSIFHIIREQGAILLQPPYDSFTASVERFLREAGEDPKVLAIKMTLYRTSTRSSIVDYLIRAAQNGKQVAVVVELQARFDEEANIRLATRMEEAGIHVTYGVVGLKTHCKVILVVRQDFNGLRRYVHIGTGNYHPLTARLYSDLGLFFSDRDIGCDATELFNYLTTGYTPKRHYLKLLVAPKMLKRALLDKIEREMAQHGAGNHGHIQFKMNALEDVDICRALYRAAKVGVRVDLLVRDSCRVRPGLPGVSETLKVVSLVGRFLEHARIYYFRNGGAEEYFIGSADAMKRNLEYRVEVLVPVEEAALRREIRQMLDVQWQDQRLAWEMQSDGSYRRRKASDDAPPGSQQLLAELADKRHRDATRLRKRKTRHLGGDEFAED